MRMVRPILVVATVFTVSAETRPLDNYRSIIDRNPFGLKPVPPPVVTPPVTAAPPPEKKVEFYLTGISSVGFPKTPKTVYLVNKDQSKKEYHDRFYKLRLNEPQGDVSLMEIDEANRKVKIKNKGEEIVLSMKDNAMPGAAGPVAGAAAPFTPGMPVPGIPTLAPGAAPAGAMPLPGAIPQPATQPAFPMNTAPVNNSIRRTPRSNNTFNNMNQNMGVAPGIPTFPQPTAAQAAAAPEENVDPAILYLKPKLEEQNARNQGKVYPPLPTF